MSDHLHELLQAVRDGSVSVEQAELELKKAPFEDLGYAKIDLHRALRQGAAEVIYGAGKTPEQIARIAAALREEFPKANKGTVSMALHTNDYGVKFCTRAQEIYDAVTQQKPRRPHRVKPIRLQCRLTESTAQRVKQALERNGIASMQTFLESLVLAWLAQSECFTTWTEKGESAAGGDDTDSAYRKNNLASNSTAKEADLSSAQNVPLS